MIASDSPTNLAWLINQNSPIVARRAVGSRRAHGPTARRHGADFAGMTISPEMLDRSS